MTATFDHIQNITSTNVDFGVTTILSADSSTLIVFSNVKKNYATVDIYQYKTNISKFVFVASQTISSDGGIDGDVVLAQDGSYFIVGSKQKYNATASLFKINTTDKKILPIYKVCSFALTGVTEYAAYRLIGSPSSDYLTLSDGKNYTEAFVWDKDIRNFRSITQFHYPDETEKHAFAKNTTIVTRPMLTLSDDGKTGILIRYKRHAGGIVSDTTDLKVFAVKADSMTGKQTTASSYSVGSDINIDEERHKFYVDNLRPVRSSFNGLLANTQDGSYISNANGKLYVENSLHKNLLPDKRMTHNYNGGLIGTTSSGYAVYRIAENQFPKSFINELAGNVEDNRVNADFLAIGSDNGFFAVPVNNEKENTFTVNIYKHKNYPNFYVPSSYPAIKVKDLATGKPAETVDTDKFLVTITYKN